MSHVLSDDAWRHIVQWCDPYPALRWVDRRLWYLLRGRDVSATLHHGNDIQQLNAYLHSLPSVHRLSIRLPALVAPGNARDMLIRWPTTLTDLSVELRGHGVFQHAGPWFMGVGSPLRTPLSHLHRLRLTLEGNAITTPEFVELWNSTVVQHPTLSRIDLNLAHNDIHDLAALAHLRPLQAVHPTHGNRLCLSCTGPHSPTYDSY